MDSSSQQQSQPLLPAQQQTQASQHQAAIPPTIDEESTSVSTGNGDAIHHAPLLQVWYLFSSHSLQ